MRFVAIILVIGATFMLGGCFYAGPGYYVPPGPGYGYGYGEVGAGSGFGGSHTYNRGTPY